MPWPWVEMWKSEMDLYNKIKGTKENLTDSVIAKYTNQKPWSERISKAAFFASYRLLRRLVWDQAVLRPDLIDAPFHLSNINFIEPWNKNSKEPSKLHGDAFHNFTKMSHNASTQRPGFVSFLKGVSQDKEQSYQPGSVSLSPPPHPPTPLPPSPLVSDLLIFTH